MACITLTRLLFVEILGIELSSTLTATARSNVRTAWVIRTRKVSVRQYCAGDPGSGPLQYLYLYNPFRTAVVARVMHNLRDSLLSAPRALTLIYRYPGDDPTIDRRIFPQVSRLDLPMSHRFFVAHPATT